MSHLAGNSEKLVTADVVSIATTSASPWAISKGLTVSNPVLGAARFLSLPDPFTVPAGMKFEVKDGAGNASTHSITVSAPTGVLIDGSSDPDVINRNWGGKTFVSTGSAYIITNGQVRETIAPAQSGGSYNETFGGSAGDSPPSGWTQSQTGGWLNGNGVWSISGDLWDATGGNSTSLIGEGEGGGGNSTTYGIWNGTPPNSTLTYDAGTLAAGTVISWQWRKDFYYTYYHNLRFRVNGSTEATCPHNSNWNAGTYTIPTTAPYILEFWWYPDNHMYSKTQYASYHSSCFIDTFVIS